MTVLREAEDLVAGINRALIALQAWRPNPCQESEVEFRFDALIGVLIMARNDAIQMEKEWQIETGLVLPLLFESLYKGVEK